MVLSRNTIQLSAKRAYNIAQSTIIHIKTSFNKNSSLIYLKLIALLDMVIKNSTHKIVCTCNSVHISGKMKINIFHRNNLTVAATCSSALDSENRTQRRLTKSHNSILSDFGKRLTQTDTDSGFPLSCRSWINGSYKNKLSVFIILYSFN